MLNYWNLLVTVTIGSVISIGIDVSGISLYVSTRGHDEGSNCTEHAPCKTVQYAVGKAQAGDQILIEGQGKKYYYPIHELTIDKQLKISLWKSAPTLECVNDTFGERESVENCDITIQSQASGSQTTGINFQKCRLCLQVSNFTSDSVICQNSEITFAAADDDTNVTVGESHFINTSITLLTSASSTNHKSEINFNLSESTLRGSGSFISATGNIAELNIDIHSCNISDIDGQGVISLANYGELSLRVRESRISAINTGSYGIALSGGETSQTIFDINTARFDNVTSKGAFIYLPHGGGKIIATIVGSSFTKVESRDSGSVFSIGEPISEAQTNVEPLKSENTTTIVTLSSVEIKNCSSSESGGAIYMHAGELHLRNCSFINNTARRVHGHGIKDNLEKSSGGAIFASGESKVFIQDSQFMNNSAYWYGGTIATFGYLYLKQTHFENSDRWASLAVGDILYAQGETVIDNVTFSVIGAVESIPVIWYNSQLFRLKGENGGYVEFHCPLGAKFWNHTLSEKKSGQLQYTDFHYFCEPCPEKQYSIQHGYATGKLSTNDMHCSSDVQCKDCPYGASCSQGHVSAIYNYWGYVTKSENNTLDVTMVECPDGYCCQDDICASYNVCATDRQGPLCGECEHGMGEVLFFPTCVPDKSCDDTWFFPLSFLAAVIGVLLFMYQEEIFGIGNKLFAKNNPENSQESDTTNGKRRVKIYNKETTKDMGYFKTIFYFYQCVPLLTVQTNMAQAYLTWALSPIIIALVSFKPLSLFINICPFPGLTHVSRTLLGNMTTFLTFALLGIAAVANKIYCYYKLRNRNNRPEPRSEEDISLLSSGESQPQTNSPPSINARIAFATVNLFLFSYVNIASVTWQMIGCIQLGNDIIMYFDGVQTCYQPWQYVFFLIMFIHVMPFFLVVIVSRSLLESDKISVTQFFLSYVLPLPMLLFWFCAYLKDIFQNVRTPQQLKAKLLKKFAKANPDQSNNAIQDVDYGLMSISGQPSRNRRENPIENIIESSNHDNRAIDDNNVDDVTLCMSNEEDHSIKAEILLVVSEPYVNYDNPSQSVKYWEGVLILRRLALSICAVVYPNELLTTTLQTAICLLFLVWHVFKQPFGSRGPNNLETFFLTSLTSMSALHMIQGTLATMGVKVQGPTLAQMFVTDWIELLLQAALPLVTVAYIVLWILVKVVEQLVTATTHLFTLIKARVTARRGRSL